MKILNKDQIKKTDAYTIKSEPITSIKLMERASQKVADWIDNHFIKDKKEKHFTIFAGKGNNGGDGLAIARLLSKKGHLVDVYICHFKEEGSSDFEKNLKRLPKKIGLHHLYDAKKLPKISTESIIIDAIFGIGISSPIKGFTQKIVDHINKLHHTVISIDMPSGLPSEEIEGFDKSHCIKASFTLTFQLPKLSFFLKENDIFLGKWETLNIGLSSAFIQKQESHFMALDFDLVRSILAPRPKYGHKGTFGKACLLAGGSGIIGAAILAAKACLKSGVGTLSVQLPKSGVLAMHAHLPEAMILNNEEFNYVESKLDYASFDALGIGPGIGNHLGTQKLIKAIIQDFKGPIVFDADALNILSENKTWLSFLSPYTILTPHVGEFQRLIGKEFKSDWEMIQEARSWSFKYNCILVVKRAYTIIATPNQTIAFNTTGNPGMATAGSGDVLTGIITALLAQGYDPIKATYLGVYVHGLAGDFAKEKVGMESLIASDISDNLSHAFQFLHS